MNKKRERFSNDQSESLNQSKLKIEQFQCEKQNK